MYPEDVLELFGFNVIYYFFTRLEDDTFFSWKDSWVFVINLFWDLEGVLCNNP